MKKNIGRKVLAIFIFLIVLASLSGCGSKEIVLVNPGFENGMTESGGISEWQRADYNGKLQADNPFTRFSVVDEGYEGKALCIENFQNNDARVYQHIDAPVNSKYKITAMVKTENVAESGAGASISIKDFIMGDRNQAVYGTQDWTMLTLYVDVTNKPGGFDLCMSLGGYSSLSSGKAYFDNVTVERVSAIPSGAYFLTVYEPEASKSDTTPEGNIAWVDNLFKVLFFGVVGGLIVYIIILSARSDKMRFKKKVSLSVSKGKADKVDIIIVAIMTFVIGIVSFVNLGDSKAPVDYWRPCVDGEYITVEFDEVIDVSKWSHYSNVPNAGKYSLYYEEEDGSGVYTYYRSVEENYNHFFKWVAEDVTITTKRVRIVAERSGWPVNEMAFYTRGSDGEFEQLNVKIIEEQSFEKGKSGTAANLFNEQDLAQYKRSNLTGTIFDEIYHPRTAYEHANWLPVYENTHPPLGKLIIAIGIQIFGMNPFGWRFMGTLMGVMLVPLMYFFGLKIFKKRLYAFASGALMMFDCMRLTQTRLATIDTYSVVFVVLMYYFIYDYYTTKSYDLKFVQSLKPLAFCGLSFGVGIASKWTSMYAGAGLAFLFFLAKYMEYRDIEERRHSWSNKGKSWFVANFIPTCIACVLFFVIIPATIYTLSYIPYKAGDPDSSLLSIMWDNQLYMYKYHSGLNSAHDFSSPWWQWPLVMRPMWYYAGDRTAEGIYSTISAMGNPAIWWLSIPAVIMSLFIAWKKYDKKMIVIFVAFAMQLCPWMLVTRCTFIYHFFTSVPFVILLIVYCAQYIIESKKINPYNGASVIAMVFAPITAACIFAFPKYAPVTLVIFMFGLVSYLMERFGSKLWAQIIVPVILAVVTIVCIFFYPSVSFVTGAMLWGYGIDLLLRIKNKDTKGLSMFIYYLAVVAGLFIAFYPVMTGLPVPEPYIEELEWFPTWYF